MPFIQNVKAKPPDITQFKLSNYSKGLNNVKSSFVLENNESPNLLNVMCFDDGSIETRPGAFKYFNTELPEEIKYINKYETSTASYLMLSSSTKLYQIDTVTEVITEVCSVNDVISGTQINDSFFFVDGDKYREYDGTDVYEIETVSAVSGLVVSGTPTTIVLDANASSVDDYYKDWYICVATDTGTEIHQITDYVGSTKTCTTESFITTPVANNVYYISSTQQGTVYTDLIGLKKYYSPTYAEFADTYKGLNNILDIKTCNSILYHNGRCFYSLSSTNKNIVYYSGIYQVDQMVNPYYIPTSQWRPAITNDADYIKGIYSFNEALIIFKSQTIFALYGYDYDDFQLKEVTVSTGLSNINTVVKADNNLIYLGSNGVVYSLYDVRTDVKKVMTKDISSDSIDLNVAPIQLYEDTWSSARAIYAFKKYLLAIDDKVLMYDGDGWFLWNNLNPKVFFKYDNTILFTNQSNYIYRYPFAPFHIKETFTSEQGQTEYVLNKSYISDVGGIIVKVNDVDVNTVDKIDNKTFRISGFIYDWETAQWDSDDWVFASGQTVTIEHTSMMCYNDYGNAYTSFWESKDLDFNYASKSKQIKRLYITANTYVYYTSQMQVDGFFDYNPFTTEFSLENRVSLFGDAKFGELWVNTNIVNSQSIKVTRRGKMLRLKVYNDVVDSPWKLYNVYGEIIIRMNGR